jgi:hypothetical protein
MSVRDVPPDETPRGDGATTAGEGTPFAVDVSADRRARWALAMFVTGPVIWSVHFMVVYLAVEAGCNGEGPGLRLFDPPVPTVVTLVATALAALACLASARWSWGRWRAGQETGGEAGEPGGPDRLGALAFAGSLLSLLGLVTVLLVGLPALVLPAC